MWAPLTEGDILWGLKRYHGLDIEGAEDIPISSFERKRDYLPVTVNTSMDQLVEAAMNQNFVPVVDDPRRLYRHRPPAGYHQILLRQVPPGRTGRPPRAGPRQRRSANLTERIPRPRRV